MSKDNETKNVAQEESPVIVDFDNIGGKFGGAVNAMIAQLVKDGFMASELGEAKKTIEANIAGIMDQIKAETHPVKMIDLVEELKLHNAQLDNVHTSAVRMYFNDTISPFTGKTTEKMGKKDGWNNVPKAVYFAQCRAERQQHFGPNSVILVHNDQLTPEQWQEVDKADFDPVSTEITNNIHVFTEDANNKTLRYEYSLGTCDSPTSATKAMRMKLGNDTNAGIHTTGYEKPELALDSNWVVKQLTGK